MTRAWWQPSDPRNQYSNVYAGFPSYLTDRPTRKIDRLFPTPLIYDNFRILDIIGGYEDDRPVHWVYIRCVAQNPGLIAAIGFSHLTDADGDYPCYSVNLDWLPDFWFDDTKYAILDFLRDQFPTLFPDRWAGDDLGDIPPIPGGHPSDCFA